MHFVTQILHKFSTNSIDGDASFGPESAESFDVLRNLKLLPIFNEKDPETFFSLFERVAETRNWPESARTLMLQCALTGRAQEAYSALSLTDSQNYSVVKSAVLKAYELVPEAYRQRFRTWKKADKQTHLEYARDLTSHFTRWCSALKVDNFDDLCNLMVLEQFKNSIPESIAQHISDQKVRNVTDAAALADDFVLTHKRSFGQVRTGSAASVGGRVDPSTVHYSAQPGKPEFIRYSDKVCTYCHKKGHLRADCYSLKAKTKQGPVGRPNGVCLAVSIGKPQTLNALSEDDKGNYPSAEFETFLPFVSDGYVSLVGSEVKVPVKILRDTAAFNSFIQASVLPFSVESETGGHVPVLGMGMTELQVPLHNIMLHCDLFQGQISVGVRPALPIEGITLILGNGVAGGRVWAAPPPPTASSVGLLRMQPDENEVSPDVSAACAVTRSMKHKSEAEAKSETKGEASHSLSFSLSDVPLSVSQEELKVEQQADASLNGLFEQVLPNSEVKNKSHCYFLYDELLSRISVNRYVPQYPVSGCISVTHHNSALCGAGSVPIYLDIWHPQNHPN